VAEVPGGYEILYTRDSADGSLRPFFTVTPHRTPREFGATTPTGVYDERRLGFYYAGASSDFRRQFFEANDALAVGAVDGGKTKNNLYESVEGQLRLVNVLPNGSSQPNAWFGAPAVEEHEAENSARAISADGSRVFWTDMSTGSLYVRENGTSTVLVGENATFWTASVDGSRVFYAKGGDLYEDDLTTEATSDLTPGGQVLGLAGASEDASYVYFVAEAVLAPGATVGKPNLYLYHGGVIKLVATLGPVDFEVGAFASGAFNDWRPALGHRTAEATPDGRGLVFMSTASLTGYNNNFTNSFSNQLNPAFEVFVYDAVGGGLSCASCNPSDESPTHQFGGILPITLTSPYQLRLISDDGSRVVFESFEPLVAQDVNDNEDVYEWERDGTGSCRAGGGCIYLLSDGSGVRASFLIDASASGADVFMVTDARLVGQDQNELFDVYDAHIGAVTPPSPSQCTGSGCQGAPGAPPVFATPSSVTFSGVGNFPAPARAVAKKKPKAKVRHRHRGKKARRSGGSARRSPVGNRAMSGGKGRGGR
jgi:hypothetical protein